MKSPGRGSHDETVVTRRLEPPEQRVERVARHREVRAACHTERAIRESGRELVGAATGRVLGQHLESFRTVGLRGVGFERRTRNGELFHGG